MAIPIIHIKCKKEIWLQGKKWYFGCREKIQKNMVLCIKNELLTLFVWRICHQNALQKGKLLQRGNKGHVAKNSLYKECNVLYDSPNCAHERWQRKHQMQHLNHWLFKLSDCVNHLCFYNSQLCSWWTCWAIFKFLREWIFEVKSCIIA